MSRNTVSRETAEVVFHAIHQTYNVKPRSGPHLRGPEYEKLPPGGWSIDWEHGGRTWNQNFSAEFGLPAGCGGSDVVIKPIGPHSIGIFPA